MLNRDDGTWEVHVLDIGKARRVLAPGENSPLANTSWETCEHVSEEIMFSKNCQEYGSTHSEQMELNLVATAYHLELPMCYRKSSWTEP